MSFILNSCKKDDEVPIQIAPCGIDFNTTAHYMAIGDEFSSGLFITPTEAWPQHIVDFIEDQGIGVSEFVILGDIGATTEEISDLFENSMDSECKNLVTIMAGASDQLSGVSASEFQLAFEELLAQAIGITDDADKVICVTIPDYSIAPGLPPSAGTPDEVKLEIEAFNQIISQKAESLGARIADIYPISESAYQILYVPEDSLHADADQHSIWANVISAQVLQSLD
ncbi:MAG: hypothetical protein HKN45_03375 [Flavobacteriales bacterium]|nr:hypothetical protein [Flavobacteriales bacterium]NNK80464.1 hypothetical protein [Flavobacteriales bacterium]